jgi:hypothetical protein
MDRAEEKARPEDVGDQALMRGLDTALSAREQLPMRPEQRFDSRDSCDH